MVECAAAAPSKQMMEYDAYFMPFQSFVLLCTCPYAGMRRQRMGKRRNKISISRGRRGGKVVQVVSIYLRARESERGCDENGSVLLRLIVRYVRPSTVAIWIGVAFPLTQKVCHADVCCTIPCLVFPKGGTAYGRMGG